MALPRRGIHTTSLWFAESLWVAQTRCKDKGSLHA